MRRVLDRRARLLTCALAGSLVACVNEAPSEVTLESPAGPVEPVVQQASAPESIVVSDDPPQELVFSSRLDSSQRNLIDSAFTDRIANARGPATPTAASFDLNGDGQPEQFVIIKSDGWCGSGDVCNMWIYEQQGEGWAALSSGNDAASCVSILPTATGGYRDVRLHGQCAVDMCTFDLRWDGNQYAWDGNRDCEQILPSR